MTKIPYDLFVSLSLLWFLPLLTIILLWSIMERRGHALSRQRRKRDTIILWIRGD
jgi:hypothetical protein